MSRLRRIIPRGLKRSLRRIQHRAQVRAITRAHARAAPAAPDQVLQTTLVIPVHNDSARLARLLEAAQNIGFAQIIVIDDGSDVPVQADNVTLIRHEAPLGPGPARNAGIKAATAPYLTFIDSDDLPTAELPLLLADLAEVPTFDICMFKHADSRFSNGDHWGQPDWDEALWQAAGLAIGTLAEAPRSTWPLLAQTANYPWNKVYRTAFLRDHTIHFAGTPVHEDITAHWLSFVHAGRILTSDRACVWHMIAAEEGRQTNRRGAERIAVFDALAPVVAATVQPDMRIALVRFVLGLADWIRGTLDDTHRPAFEMALQHWLTVTIASWHSNIAAHDPALHARLTTQA